MKKRIGLLAAAALFAALLTRQLVLSQPAVAQLNGVTVPIPSGWQWNSSVTTAGGPISLNNFNSKYLSGGILPPGGAEIEVPRPEPPPSALGDLVREETQGASAVVSKEFSLAGGDAIRVAYQDAFGTLQYANIACYTVRGGKLYKFYLSHHAGDPNASNFAKAFDQLVATTRTPPAGTAQ